MGLQLVQPRLQRGHRLGPQPKDPYTGIIGSALIDDHAGLEQHPKVTTHRWRRHASGFGELTSSTRPGAQKLYDAASRLVAQRLKQGTHLIA